jgi:hypothetical protein
MFMIERLDAESKRVIQVVLGNLLSRSGVNCVIVSKTISIVFIIAVRYPLL